jgi:proline iminopeptidase
MKKLILSFGLVLILLKIAAQEIKSFKTSDGETLYFRTVGKGTKVIILSGGPGFGADGLNVWADLLSGDFEGISFHQRGTGFSDNAKLDSSTINLKRAVQDLGDLRKNLGLEKLTLCGHSWGGMLAQAYASTFPDNTEKIVLINPGGPDMSFWPVFFNDNIPMRRFPAERDSLEFWDNQPDSEASIFKRGLFFVLPYFYDHEIGLQKMPTMMKLSPFNDRMNNLILKDLYLNYDLNSRLGNYKNHCIIIRSRQDIIQAEVICQIKELLPQAEIITIEKSGHFPHLEQPDEFYRILREVL